MDAIEQKLKRKMQVIVACAMTVFFVLITALALTFAIRLNQEAQIHSLEVRAAELNQQVDDLESDIDYFKSGQFADDHALRYMGWGKDGSKFLK